MYTQVESERSIFIKESGRFLTYGVLVVLLAEFMKWTASVDDGEIKFSEFTYVEYGQSLLLFLCSAIGIGFYLSKNTKEFRYIFLLIFGLSTAALIREQDIYFEELLGHGAWPYPVYAVLGFVAFKVYKGWGEAWKQVVGYVSSKSYAFMTFGMITVFIFSRLYGRTKFWETVMEEKYFRSVKNVSEECLELYGYLFMFFAVVELVILVRKNRENVA
jgi:hypothetical protein